MRTYGNGDPQSGQAGNREFTTDVRSTAAPLYFFHATLSILLGSTHKPDRVIMHFTQDNVPDSVFEWSGLRNRDYSAFSHWSHASSQSTAPIIIPFFFPLAP